MEDVAAERAVLAGIVQHGQNALCDVQDIITVDCFTNASNQVIYTCLTKTLDDSSTVDIPSFLAVASGLGLESVIKNELDFIRSLFNLPIKEENVRQHAKKIRKLHFIKECQKQIKVSYTELEELDGSESISEIISVLEAPIFNVTHQLDEAESNKPQKILADIEEHITYLVENECELKGISTGYNIFDDAIGGGLRRGSVNLIGARPGVGKSSHAKEVSVHVSKELNIPVLYLDTEMNAEDQKNRIIAGLSNTAIRKVESGQFAGDEMARERVADVVQYKDIPFYYENITGKPFDEILSIVRRWLMQEVGMEEDGTMKDCVIIYDYFKLMDAGDLDDMQEFQVLGFQMQKLTDFVIKHDIACMSYVQLNRDGITKESSDVISQSDRLLWFCGSLSIFKDKAAEEMVEDGKQNGNRKLITVKHRYGAGLAEGDYINMNLAGDFSQLTEISTNSQAKSGYLVQGFGRDESIDTEEEVPFN